MPKAVFFARTLAVSLIVAASAFSQVQPSGTDMGSTSVGSTGSSVTATFPVPSQAASFSSLERYLRHLTSLLDC